MLGSYIVGKYAGMTYPEFIKARIWDPLNMSDTTFYQREASRHGKLTQAWASNGRRIPIWWNDEQVSMNAGPGGILSSAEDMVSSMLRGALPHNDGSSRPNGCVLSSTLESTP